ncbi:two-component system, OmpR family, sensor histidine kinase KdpD [Granulicella rosea]|uniref:histidine kinase n=1 Tax=Granulicella rosea TaxID=474952 RepID=A0A239EG97_9BACT|nr:two-component system, OmpR family, sensor histidine kinase KdpD [Granulicella rosea]
MTNFEVADSAADDGSVHGLLWPRPGFLRKLFRRADPIRWLRSSAQCAVGIGLCCVFAIVGAASNFDLSTASLVYLLVVVVFALYCGFWQASVVSMVAILCEIYFFAPPTYSFRIAEGRHVFAILAFETIALAVSRLSASERESARASQQMRVKIQRLYAVSRGALLLCMSESVERQLAELILKEFQLEGVAIFNGLNGAMETAGEWARAHEALRSALRLRSCQPLQASPGTLHAELRSKDGYAGVVVVIGDVQQLALDSLASLLALTLERHRAFVKEGESEAARRTEELRSTVLDGLAHAFKTPLTIIRAASSGLLEAGHLDSVQTELTSMIDEQSERLNELATRLLQTARMESAHLSLHRETLDAGALLHEVVDRFRARGAESVDDAPFLSPISIKVSEPMLALSADHEMLRSTLGELLDNAAKYSSAGTRITLAATRRNHELLFSIHNWGKVILPADRRRIFERFYRSPEQRHHAPGTGIGLSVAHRAAAAHQGHIWVTSSEQEGTTFHLSLPMTPLHQQAGGMLEDKALSNR